jgi:hypothetical protein
LPWPGCVLFERSDLPRSEWGCLGWSLAFSLRQIFKPSSDVPLLGASLTSQTRISRVFEPNGIRRPKPVVFA